MLKIKDLICEADKNSEIILSTVDGLMKCKLEEFLKQPIEGVLYDLNRDKATCLTWIEKEEVGWINNYASAKVIEYLLKQINELNK